jgi:uncharacterized delta-60 repeat protein
MRCVPFVLTVIAALAASSSAFSQTLDAFNPAPGIYPTTIAAQSDGKILIAGNFLSVGTTVRERMARLNSDGSLDTSFVDPMIDSEVKAIAVQPDGKILVAGSFDAIDTTTRHYLARLNSDGTLDTTFADPAFDSTVWGLAIQPDGNILAAGDFSNIGAHAQKYFARITSTGGFDSTFADPQLCCSVARTVAIQSNGDVVIGGYFSEVHGSSNYSYLARFTSTGVQDTTFPNVSAVLNSQDLVIGPDGSIYLGFSGSPSVRKLKPNGTLDTTFNGATSDGSVNSMVLQPDGKLVIGGTFGTIGGASHHALARLNADGSVDSTFADLDFLLNADGPNAYVENVVEQTNGDIVIGGNFLLADGQSRQYMTRATTTEPAVSRLTGAASGGSVVLTWTRTGSGPELTQPPILMHSTDGVNFTAVGTMTRIATGWQETANYNVSGTPFYLRADGYTSSGANNESIGRLSSPVYVSDRIFADGFE